MQTRLSSFMESIPFLNYGRRQDFRHQINCDGMLNICFPDFQDNLTVKVSNFSTSGALLYANQIFVGHRHLISIDYPPQLNLIMKFPEEYFESPVEIRWYKWSVKRNCFEIGIRFILMFKETRIAVNRFISSLKSGII